MPSADERFVVTYNGETYNHAELRAELEAEGKRFRGHSDTEVIVEGFASWGPELLVERLIGMFAFAVWDRRERALTRASRPRSTNYARARELWGRLRRGPGSIRGAAASLLETVAPSAGDGAFVPDLVERLEYLDTLSYLPDDILARWTAPAWPSRSQSARPSRCSRHFLRIGAGSDYALWDALMFQAWLREHEA